MCSQRKYHYTRLRFMTGSPANGCLQRWCLSLCPLVNSPPNPWTLPAHPLPGSTQAEHICLPYAVVKRLLSACKNAAFALRFCRPAHYQKDDASLALPLPQLMAIMYADSISRKSELLGTLVSFLLAILLNLSLSPYFQQAFTTVLSARSTA